MEKQKQLFIGIVGFGIDFIGLTKVLQGLSRFYDVFGAADGCVDGLS